MGDNINYLNVIVFTKHRVALEHRQKRLKLLITNILHLECSTQKGGNINHF
jgi:hypothetical protein